MEMTPPQITTRRVLKKRRYFHFINMIPFPHEDCFDHFGKSPSTTSKILAQNPYPLSLKLLRGFRAVKLVCESQPEIPNVDCPLTSLTLLVSLSLISVETGHKIYPLSVGRLNEGTLWYATNSFGWTVLQGKKYTSFINSEVQKFQKCDVNHVMRRFLVTESKERIK